MIGCFTLCFFTCWIFSFFGITLDGPSRPNLRVGGTSFLRPKKKLEAMRVDGWNGWNGWTWTMAGGPGSHLQIWRLNDWIWLKHALGTCCHFLFQSFKRDFLGQLKSLEPVHFGSIHVSELIWNQIYVRYMAAGFSSNFRRDTSNQVQILS